MYALKLTDKQILSFVQECFIKQSILPENLMFFNNEKVFITTIKNDQDEPLLRENHTYILLKEIKRSSKANAVFVTGFSVLLTGDKEIKSSQLIKFKLQDFQVSFQSALLYENGEIRKDYAQFMFKIFGEKYKEDYNKFLKKDIDNQLLK